MVQINFAHKEIQCKIVYYGPGMSGKTTNLELVHEKTPGESRGELTSIATTGERTLYFDYMPLDLGAIAGIRTKFQLYTVPGQIYYKSTRRLVLQGVDGVVFVADSSAAKLEENRESMRDLEENLREMGRSVADLPIVIQYNKRDLPDAMSVDDLQKQVNVHAFPHFEAAAKTGQGVFPTLKALAALVLEAVNRGGIGSTRTARPAGAPAAAATPTPSPAPAAPVAAASPRIAVGSPPAARPSPAYEPQEPSRSAPKISIAASDGPRSAPGQAPRISIAASASESSSATAVATRPVAAPPRPVAQPAPAPLPTMAPSAAPMATPSNAPAAAAAPAPKPAGDRYVKVAGLSNSDRGSKKLVLVGLCALIAVAAWFVISRLG